MKKIFIIFITIMVVILLVFVVKYNSYKKSQNEISKFNLDYEYYNKDNLNGLDIMTIINKAITNNDKYEIPKDNNGLYVLDDKYSVEIYITMIINNTTYKMERFGQANTNDFIRYFGEVGFKCTDVQYHKKTGRISSMTFEAKEY